MEDVNQSSGSTVNDLKYTDATIKEGENYVKFEPSIIDNIIQDVKAKTSDLDAPVQGNVMEIESLISVGDLKAFQAEPNNELTSESLDNNMEKPRFARKRKKPNINVNTVERILYKCDKCSFCAITPGLLAQHVIVHTGEKIYHCPLCPYTAKSRSSVDLHLKIHKGETPVYPCSMCHSSFTNEEDFNEHMSIHSNEKPYECYNCGFKAKTKNCLAEHIGRKHYDKKRVQNTQPCVCHVCGKSYSNPTSLKDHFTIHQGIKPYLCELCGQYFRKSSFLTNHLRTHTGEKPFKCEFCDHTTSRKGLLEKHMKRHSNCRQLVDCSICAKCYTSKALLRRHVLDEHTIKVEEHSGNEEV